MNFFDYIKNKDLAVASEIYNAKFNSVDDVSSLLNKIKEEESNFDNIIDEFMCTLYNIKVCLSRIAFNKDKLNRLIEFENSHIARLIKDFVSQNTEDKLNTIKSELENSNDFRIRIVDKWKPGGGERMYGIPYSDFFNVGYTGTFYRFDKFDVDKDIQSVKNYIVGDEAEIQTYIENKNRMYDEYGMKPLMLIFSMFERDNGLTPDDKWKDKDTIDHYYDNEEDYY